MAYSETVQLSDTDRNRIDPATQQDVEALNMLLQLLKPLGIVSSGSGRILLDVGNIAAGALTSVGTVTTVTNVTTVGSVTDAAAVGGLNGFDLQYNAAHSAYAHCVLSNITF